MRGGSGMSKVSVLVAAYNAEPFIRQCIDSLLTQTLSDIEIICVDDASTDLTPSILDNYSKADTRVKVLHLSENGGQAKARNLGLKMSQGEWVCMLDADDWFSPHALESAVNVFEEHPETDCVLFQVEEVHADHSRRYPLPEFETLSGEQAFELSLDWSIHGLYMLRGQLHRAIPYDDTVRSYSDDNTTRIHYLRSKVVRQCDGVYYYRQHSASVTHRVAVNRFDYLKANESMLRQMREAKVDQRLVNQYETVRWLNLVDAYMFYFKNRRKLDKDSREYGVREMRRIWESIDVSLLHWRQKWKFGYMPMRPFWMLFRLQEELYFCLRKIARRI